MRRAIVVGGGIAGLACAHRLRQLGVDATVLETGARAGGKIHTRIVGGYEVEWGPETCIVTPALRALAGELGVRVRERPRRERARYLVRDGRLRGPLRAISLGGIARLLRGVVFAGAPAGEDESVADYSRRRFGDEAARRLFDPLVSGVFAGDPERIVFASALAKFGRRRGVTGSFEGGMGALPSALAKALGPALRLGASVAAIERGPAPAGARANVRSSSCRDRTNVRSTSWVVTTTSGGKLEADEVIVATPSYVAADLLAKLDGPLADELRGIRYNPVTAVLLGYPEAAFSPRAPHGFGFLAAREEGLPILGCLFCPAPEGKVALRPMLRGTPSDADALATARGEVERLLGASGAPEVAEVARHERAIPQYEVGHARRLRAIEERLRAIPGLRLAGNAYRGVSVPDVVEDARALAEAVASQRAAS